MLSESDERTLVIGGGVERGKAVGTGGKAVRDGGSVDAIDGGSGESFEEDEVVAVDHVGRVERRHLLDDDVRVLRRDEHGGRASDRCS